MVKYKRLLCAILAFLLVFSLGAVVSVPAHAIVLDPVAWLYPIWQAYAMQAGITVTTVGGDSFTQDSFTGLFNEWQAFEVSQGVQSAAQSISGFVDDALNFVEVVAGSGSGGVLNTVLKLEAGIVGPLSRFWNWIIADKLDAPSVDSVEFATSDGNLALNYVGYPIPVSSTPITTFSYGTYSDTGPNYAYASLPGAYMVYIAGNPYPATLSYSRDQSVVVSWFGSTGRSGYVTLSLVYNGVYYHRPGYASSGPYILNSSIPMYASVEDALSSIVEPTDEGSITVAPAVGVDVLGFPDTRDPDYVPADTNIGWNVPYDPTADTNAYLDQAYQQALDNELEESGTIDDPVTGTDEVGEVGEYVVPGLSEVFPFCLPFDVYNFLSALAADPVAPSFTAELAFPEQLGGTQYIEIDLDTSTFNQLASILRTMELLLFIVGLAYVTRSRFIRG